MKDPLRLGASRDERLMKPPRFNRERLLADVRATPGAFAPVVLMPLHALRYVLYLALLFIRIPVQVVCRLMFVPLLLFAVIWGFFKGWISMPAVVLAGAAFGLFLFSFLYDTLLLLIAPERIDLNL